MARPILKWFHLTSNRFTQPVVDACGAAVVGVATAELTIKDKASDVNLTGVAMPITLVETDPGVSGVYEIVVSSALVTTLAQVVVITAVIDDGPLSTRTFVYEATIEDG